MAKVKQKPRSRRSNTRGHVSVLRDRAIALAKAQQEDDQVRSVLRHEFATIKPYLVIRPYLEECVTRWIAAGMLTDARVAGQAAVLETLYKAAAEGGTAAAIQLVKRQEQIDGLDVSVKRELERILKMDGAELEQELAELGVQLGPASP